MISKLKEIAIRLIVADRSPTKLALAFCMGIYVAFSPFIGLHTLIMLACAWFCHLNFAMMYFASHLVNNPLTIAPLYWFDHLVGKKVCLMVFGFVPTNPLWMNWLNAKINAYTGLTGISLWAFMIGGNLLGLLASVMLYPFMVWFFNRILSNDKAT